MYNIKPANVTSDDFIYSIKNLIDSMISQRVNTILPGEVVSIENHKEASVRALVIEKESTYPPVIHHNVPIMMPGGSDGYIRYSLKPGDQGLLFTCKKDISLLKKEWKPSKTQVDRTFDINDNVFMPLVFNTEALDDEGLTIAYKGSVLHLKDTEVSIEAKEKIVVKTGSVELKIEGSKVKVYCDDEIDLISSKVKLNCQTISCPPLKENMKAVLELLDSLANGMVGSGTNATEYRTQRPLKEQVFTTIE